MSPNYLTKIEITMWPCGNRLLNRLMSPSPKSLVMFASAFSLIGDLKYASNVLVPLPPMCFNSFFSHGFLPQSMLSVVLGPVIKDKVSKISFKDNYRPIVLASVISKLVGVTMLDRIEMYMNTNPNQFGFKRKHGTDQCIYVLKEIIYLFRSVFVCLRHLKGNHRTLFIKQIIRESESVDLVIFQTQETSTKTISGRCRRGHLEKSIHVKLILINKSKC